MNELITASKWWTPRCPLQVSNDNWQMLNASFWPHQTAQAYPVYPTNFSLLMPPHVCWCNKMGQKKISQAFTGNTPPKTNMSTKAGLFQSIGNTSSNHWFSGDMLVFLRSMTQTQKTQRQYTKVHSTPRWSHHQLKPCILGPRSIFQKQLTCVPTFAAKTV